MFIQHWFYNGSTFPIYKEPIESSRTTAINSSTGIRVFPTKTSDPKAEPLPEDPDPDPPLTTETTEATDAEEWRPKRHSLCRRRGPEVHASQILSALEIGDWEEDHWGETWSLNGCTYRYNYMRCEVRLPFRC